MNPYERQAKKSRAKLLKTYQTGGAVTGVAPSPRGDRRSRGGKPDVAVIVNAGGKDQALQQGLQAGIKIGAALGSRGGNPTPPAAPPMAPPMAGPSPTGAPGPMAGGGMGMPPGMPPVGAAAAPMGPMRRPPGMKRGGAVPSAKSVHLTAGAGGGKGRIEKANDYGVPKVTVREHVRRKAGGRIG